MNKKEMNNKGFSLIELIVVIAIMAILVGALAPQLLKYIEKSRQANDVQAAGTVYTVVTTAYLDPDVTGKPTTAGAITLPTAAGTAGSFADEVWKGLGSQTVSITSKAYSGGGLAVNLKADGNIEVVLSSTDSSVPTKTIDASGAHT